MRARIFRNDEQKIGPSRQLLVVSIVGAGRLHSLRIVASQAGARVDIEIDGFEYTKFTFSELNSQALSTPNSGGVPYLEGYSPGDSSFAAAIVAYRPIEFASSLMVTIAAPDASTTVKRVEGTIEIDSPPD